MSDGGTVPISIHDNGRPTQAQIIAAQVHIECTLCGREIRNGDCGTPHQWGTAQMQLRVGRAT